jgi:anti-sigma B factor antagonist
MAASPSADIPQFEISSERGPDDVYVVRVAGEVDISHEEELRGELQRAGNEDSAGIVVDLTDCDFIDSSGVRALLVSRETQREEGDQASFAIAAASDQLLRILSVMGVDKVIPVRPTVEEASAELR